MFEPQLMDGWSTHLPLLCEAVGLTGGPDAGPVLEIGCGMYSTLVLHGICSGRQLVSLETDRAWFERFAHLEATHHRLLWAPDYDAFDALLRETPWDVVLIDHAPEPRRIVDAAKVTHARVVVFHDTNWNDAYRFDLVWPLFRRRRTDRRLFPWTTVVTNSEDVVLAPLFPTLDRPVGSAAVS